MQMVASHILCSLYKNEGDRKPLKSCTWFCYWASLIDWVKVLPPTQHKIGHFGDILHSQSLGLVLKKNKNKHNKSKIASVTKSILQHKINIHKKARFGHLL